MQTAAAAAPSPTDTVAGGGIRLLRSDVARVQRHGCCCLAGRRSLRFARTPQKGKDGADAGTEVPKISDKLNACVSAEQGPQSLSKAVILKEKHRIEKATFVAKLLFLWLPFVCISPFLRCLPMLGASAGGRFCERRPRVCGIMEVYRSIGDALKSKGDVTESFSRHYEDCADEGVLHLDANVVRLRAFPPQKPTEQFPMAHIYF
jgi:hypothetical protein